jgi:hypothetical protein
MAYDQQERNPPDEAGPMINLPTPYAAARITAFLAGHPCWTAFWDKRDGVWRVAENDPILACTPPALTSTSLLPT